MTGLNLLGSKSDPVQSYVRSTAQLLYSDVGVTVLPLAWPVIAQLYQK